MPSSNPFTHLRRKASVDHVPPVDADSTSPRRPSARLPNGRKSSSETFRLLPSPSSEAQSSRRRERTQASAAGAGHFHHDRRRSTSPASSFYAGPSLGRTVTNNSHSSGGSLETADPHPRASKRDSIGSFFHPGRKHTAATTPATTTSLPPRPPHPARSPPQPPRPTRPVPSPPFNEEHSPSSRSRIPQSPSSRSRIPQVHSPADVVVATHARTDSDLSSVLPSLPSFPSPPSGGALLDSPILATQALQPVLESSPSPAGSPRKPPSDRLLDEAIEEPRPLQLWEDGDDQPPMTATSDDLKEFAEALLKTVTSAEEVAHETTVSPHTLQPVETGLDAVAEDSSSFMSSGGSARSSSVASPEHLESLLPCVVEHDDEGVPELLLESSDSLAPSRASSRLELREEPSSVKVVVAPLLVSTPIATTLLDLDDNEPSVGSMPDDRLAAQDMSDDKELASSKGVDSPPSQSTSSADLDDLGDSTCALAVGEPNSSLLPLPLPSPDDTSSLSPRAATPTLLLAAPTEEPAAPATAPTEASLVPEPLPAAAPVAADPLADSRSSAALTPRLSDVSLSLATVAAAAMIAARSTHRRALVALACVAANSGLLLAHMLLRKHPIERTTLLGRGLAAVGLRARWLSAAGRPARV